MQLDIRIFFGKSVEKVQVSLKSDSNKGYFTWRPMYSYDLIEFFSEWGMFRIRLLESIKTHLTLIFFSENRDVNEIMWQNMVEPDRPQKKI